MKKRALSIFLALCMVLTLLPAQALAAENGGITPPMVEDIEPETPEEKPEKPPQPEESYGEAYVPLAEAAPVDTSVSGTCGDNLTWTLDDAGTLTISGTGAMADYDYPSNSGWYNHKNKITAVNIQDGVTSIGSEAFVTSYNLTSVTIPDSVTYIGDMAFWECTSLASIEIPNAVSSIGGCAFQGCTALTSVNIPTSMTLLEYSAFWRCSSLTDVYYSGTKTQWDRITIERENDPLLNATIHYNGGTGGDTPSSAKIAKLYPGNGSIYYFKGAEGDNRMRIFFDREVSCTGTGGRPELDFSVGTLQIHKASDDSVVYQMQYGTEVSSWDLDGRRTGMVLTNASANLDYGTEYYVTMPAGFAKLADGSVSPAITKGEWSFRTVANGESHSVTYQLNGGTWDDTMGESWEAGQTVDIPRTLPKKEGYRFGGWSDGTTTYQPGDTFVMPDHDVTLTAVWRAEFDYSVTYLLNGGTGDVPAAGYLAGQTVTITNKVPTKEGYVFDGWSDGSTIYQPGNTFEMPEHDVTLTAVWKESPVLSDHSVTYRLNGGIGNMPAAGYLAGQTVTVTTRTPAKDGYTFAGWSDGTTTYQPGDTFTMPDHEVTLTAVWEEIFGPYLPFFEIARDSVTVPVGGTARPRVTTANGVTVTWTSDSPAIATVDSTGIVTGISQGQTTVTGVATRGAQTKSLSYSVVVTAGVKITLKDHIINLKPNKETTLDYTALPLVMAGDNHVTYASSDISVATVSKHGTVHAVGGGTATITATLKYGDSTVTDICTVVVEQESAKKLVEIARKYVNYKLADFTAEQRKTLGSSWCANFILLCAKEAKIQGIEGICKKDGYASTLYKDLISNGGSGVYFYKNISLSDHPEYKNATFVEQRETYEPQIGDIIGFNWNGFGGIGHVGIVYDVDESHVYVIHGNYHGSNPPAIVCGPECKRGDYGYRWSKTDSQIAGYVCPAWNLLNGEADHLYKCPVDVRYSYDGEVLDSATGQMEASFGNMRLTDNGGILVHLNNYYDVDVTINGTGTGTMDITSTFRDEDGTTSVRKFQGVPITEDTIGKLYAYDSASTEILEMYNNYGKTFVNAWAASGNETVSSADAELTDWYINGDSYDNEPIDPGPTIPDYPGGSNSGPGGSSSSGGSGGGVPSVYSISVGKTANGSVTVSPKPAAAHSTVTVSVKPDSGYVLDTLTVTDKNGKDVKLTSKGTSKYTFIMPDSKVTVSAFFRLDGRIVSSVFSDVPAGYWAKGAIDWASANGYMKGLTGSVFNPEGVATRQQVWMILARLSGQSPSGMAEARIWAMNSGLTDGTKPGAPVTRQQMVTFLHRYCGMRGYPVSGSGDLTAFRDYSSASDYAKNALAWAVGSGIITGTKAGTLNPGGFATRAQFAVVLKRFYEDDFSD